ncbi:MAG: peptidoglycan D,D-transpeptidase FtsI family protein [Acidimicrobiales bacterium]
MNERIGRLALGLLVCFTLLFVQLNRVQVWGATRIKEHPANLREVLRTFDQPRGLVYTADNVVVAQSEPTPGQRFERVRRYPEADLFAHVAGFFSFEFGAAGVEQTYNERLAGTRADQQLRRLSDLFVERDTTADVVLTLRRDVQAAAKEALGERAGSVVALDPRDGRVLALWSWPSFDPNPLAGGDLAAARAARQALLADPAKPLLAKAYRERFFPGSTFKIVVAATGLDAGLVTLDEPVYEVRRTYTPPRTSRPLANFGNSSCGGSLVEITRVSCNTAFAEMGAKTIGPTLMIQGAEQFGFNATPPIDLPGAASSVFPVDFGRKLSGDGGPGSEYEGSAALAQAAIGQNDVAATPLQMALVAAAVANGGTVPTPHVMAEVRDADGAVLERGDSTPWRRALEPESADALRQAMTAVVQDGTATRLAIDGVDVGAKTGTAQLGSDPPRSHAWVIAYAGPPGRAPTVAVAVLVEGVEGADNQTGGRVAAPIARQVIEAVLAAQAAPAAAPAPPRPGG